MRPQEAQREGFLWGCGLLPLVVAGLVLLGIIIIGGQKLGFWLDTQDVKHQGKVGVIQASQNYDITQHSKAYQDGQVSIVNARIQDILGPGGLAATRASLPVTSGEQDSVRAQELNVIDHMCTAAQSILPDNTAFSTGSPSDAQIVGANCTGGQAVADPPLARNPVPDGGA